MKGSVVSGGAHAPKHEGQDFDPAAAAIKRAAKKAAAPKPELLDVSKLSLAETLALPESRLQEVVASLIHVSSIVLYGGPVLTTSSKDG